jgi:hypothetical protein
MIWGVSVGGLIIVSRLCDCGGVFFFKPEFVFRGPYNVCLGISSTITRVVNSLPVRGSEAGNEGMEAESELDCSRITGIGCPQSSEGPFCSHSRTMNIPPCVTAYWDTLFACRHIGYLCPYVRKSKYQNRSVEDFY